MGVGAIFVSTLAVTELPTPHSPPENQAELLAATLQTIVAFVVLGSIIIHGLSIPFFSFGRNVRARTLSLTHTWTLRTGSVGPAVPDWTLWARRTHEGTLTRPGTPLNVGGTDDVERGLDTKDLLASVAEPQAALLPAEDEGLEIVNMHVEDVNVDHVPELGAAAAMISGSGAAAGPARAIDIEVALAPAQEAIPVLEQAMAPAEAGNTHVNVKHAAAGNDARAVKLALPSLGAFPHAGQAGAGSDACVQSPATPSPSPSPTQRSVRFPVPPRLASHEAADRDRAPSAGFPSLAKEVHFSDEQGAAATVDVGAVEGVAGVSEGVPGSGGGGDVLQGRDAHFPASQ
ncbi:hypothetical protein VTO73DRAFT_1686 [Trametes versicolor]